MRVIFGRVARDARGSDAVLRVKNTSAELKRVFSMRTHNVSAPHLSALASIGEHPMEWICQSRHGSPLAITWEDVLRDSEGSLDAWTRRSCNMHVSAIVGTLVPKPANVYPALAASSAALTSVDYFHCLNTRGTMQRRCHARGFAAVVTISGEQKPTTAVHAN